MTSDNTIIEQVKQDLDFIKSNYTTLKTQCEELEEILSKLNSMLREMLDDSNVPHTLKFSYKRISTIDMLTNSISKIGELVRKLRENIHKMVLDELQTKAQLESIVASSTRGLPFDIKDFWLQVGRLESFVESLEETKDEETT